MLECYVGRRLDYDGIVDHTYNFTITATDNGHPVAHSGSAMVRVSVTNVNDEDPVFMQSVEHILVSEDAMPNTVIHVVQAYDPDGDDVTFSFTGELQSVDINLSKKLISQPVLLDNLDEEMLDLSKESIAHCH